MGFSQPSVFAERKFGDPGLMAFRYHFELEVLLLLLYQELETWHLISIVEFEANKFAVQFRLFLSFTQQAKLTFGFLFEWIRTSYAKG